MTDWLTDHLFVAIVIVSALMTLNILISPLRPGSATARFATRILHVWIGAAIVALLAWTFLPEHCWSVPDDEFAACLNAAAR